MHAGTRIAKLLPKYENLNVGAVGLNFCYKIELLHCNCMPRVKSSEACGIFSFRPCLTAYCPTTLGINFNMIHINSSKNHKTTVMDHHLHEHILYGTILRIHYTTSDTQPGRSGREHSRQML